MEIQSTGIGKEVKNSEVKSSQSAPASEIKFSDELKELENSKKSNKNEETKNTPEEKINGNEKINSKPEDCLHSGNNSNITVAMNDLNGVVTSLNQSVDKIKEKPKFADNDFEGTGMINNDFNIENKDKLPQMSSNMSFNTGGQPFSSFMNGEGDSSNAKLSSTAKDLAEEAAVLSTMAENIAMANKAGLNEKTVVREDGIKKVDTKSNITKEVIVSYGEVIMNKADVEFFVNLVEGNLKSGDLRKESVHKSLNISKTLADLIAKSIENNKPVRIEFDNGISVIIKISRDGKLSADFLPSTQVAEAYLKENLPLLKQRFDEQNLEYGELNRRERQNRNRDENQKKGRENE